MAIKGTREALADALGVHPHDLALWLAGKASPPEPIFERVLEIILDEKAPALVTVGEVIRAMSGPFVQLSCLDSGNFADDCGKQNKCEFKPIWAEVDRAIGGVLNNITFEELVRRSRTNQRQLMYHI